MRLLILILNFVISSIITINAQVIPKYHFYDGGSNLGAFLYNNYGYLKVENNLSMLPNNKGYTSNSIGVTLNEDYGIALTGNEVRSLNNGFNNKNINLLVSSKALNHRIYASSGLGSTKFTPTLFYPSFYYSDSLNINLAESKKNYFDLSVGAEYLFGNRNGKYKPHCLGVNIEHLNKPKDFQHISRHPIIFNYYTELFFYIGQYGLQTGAIVSHTQTRYNELNMPLAPNYDAYYSLYSVFMVRKLSVGIGFMDYLKHQKSLYLDLGYYFPKKITLRYLPVMNIHSNNERTYSHQVSINWRFMPNTTRRYRYCDHYGSGGGGGGSYSSYSLNFLKRSKTTMENTPIPISSTINYLDSIDFNTEEYDKIYENPFLQVQGNPLSTFSIDVDNASYSNARRFLNNDQMPPKNAVRVEEFINYFDYDYPQPKGEHPFEVFTEISDCPWRDETQLVHIGIQGKDIDYENLSNSNLVFLIDVSGSMNDNNKLTLVKSSLKILVNQLQTDDRISIVVYSGYDAVLLKGASGNNKELIIEVIDSLYASGYTAGAIAIKTAYKLAKQNLIPNGNNRIILCTDGDFNVGISSTSALVDLIEEKRKDDIYITICGFGMGNYKDGRMEQISNAGNGNYFYIDKESEAKKVFVTDLRATMFTIAKDVKLQVEFNPTRVKEYRLIGYENRILQKEDFNDDKKDAGELGAGHTVTAIYEVLPIRYDSDSSISAGSVDPLKYQETVIKKDAYKSKELLTLKLRYKNPKDTISQLIEIPIKDKDIRFSRSSDNYKFSAAVASFGMLLRESKYVGDFTYDDVIKLAIESSGTDKHAYRKEFIELVKKAKKISK